MADRAFLLSYTGVNATSNANEFTLGWTMTLVRENSTTDNAVVGGSCQFQFSDTVGQIATKVKTACVDIGAGLGYDISSVSSMVVPQFTKL